jgi:beta-lactamase regulating signal transducer with metallopeptidase domain
VEWLIQVGLSNSLVAGALAGLAALVGLVCRRPALMHALWLLVLLKLVTPPLVMISVRPPAGPANSEEPASPAEATAPGPLSLLGGPDRAGGEVPSGVGGEDRLPARPAEALANDDEAAPPAVEDPIAPEAVEASAPPPPDARGWRPGSVLAGAWLLGSLAWCTLAIRRAWRFSRALRCARPAPASLCERVRGLAGRIGLARCPPTHLIPGRVAPMVWGLGRPALLVPEGLENQVGEGGLDTLLLHELAHVRRRDHLVRWLELLALAAFWWNPIAWYARRELREAEEQCCDAWVVRTLPATRRTYATALVDALDFLCETRPALPPLASGLGQAADLKRRLTMILRGNTPHGLGRSSGLVVLGVALALLPFVPVWGRAQDKPVEAETLRERLLLLQQEGAANDLKKMQAEIEKRAAELAELKAKMIKMKQKEADEANARKKAEVLRAGGILALRGGSGGPVIRIEISGLQMDAKDLKKLAEALEKTLPGKEKRVIILGGNDPRGAILRLERAKGALHLYQKALEAPKPKLPLDALVPRSPAPTDKRIESVEKKLDRLLRELETLRKELRPGGPPGGGGNPFGRPPGGGAVR